MVAPFRSMTQEAFGGLVETIIACDVPSKMTAQPDTATPSAATAAMVLTFIRNFPQPNEGATIGAFPLAKTMSEPLV